jgi:small subunit ribosomal protein S8
MTDPIADMLTRIRNANSIGEEVVNIPASKIKLEMVKLLKEEGFISNYKLARDNKQGVLTVFLKYGPHKERVISRIERLSRPGRRFYAQKGEIPKVLGGLGVAIISTSRGLMTDRRARQEGVGGEILCMVS